MYENSWNTVVDWFEELPLFDCRAVSLLGMCTLHFYRKLEVNIVSEIVLFDNFNHDYILFLFKS